MNQQISGLTSVFSLLLFSSFPTLSFAQSPFVGNPSTTTSAPSSATTSGIPNSLGYTGTDQNTGSGSSISNYYFIIIGVAIIVVLIATWIIVRRRQRRNPGDQDGTARDSRRWPMPNMPRWRATRIEPRLEEGLNEAGEAPPPYIPGEQDPPPPEFEAAAAGGPIPLQTLGKPPDYDGHSSEEDLDLDLTRPNPTYNPHARFSSRSPMIERQFSSENTLGPSETTGTEMPEMQSVEPSSETEGDNMKTGAHTEMGELSSPGMEREGQPPAVNVESGTNMQAEPAATIESNRNSRLTCNSVRSHISNIRNETLPSSPRPTSSANRLSHTGS